MKYGVPYMGSKNRLAKKIIDALPAGEVFVDLFAGGCAVTHAALLSGKYKKVIANNIGNAPQLFLDAIKGKYANETRWISREDFFKLKDTDPYVKYCWSFGNAGSTYIYGGQIEAKKKALHYAIVFKDTSLLKEYGIDADWAMDLPTPHERRLAICGRLKKEAKRCDLQTMEANARLSIIESLERLERLQSLEQLERLQSLERLERLQSLERLEISKLDYRDVPIPDGAVIYCDPPYKGKAKYDNSIDYDDFYNYCSECKYPIFISEYEMPSDRFEIVEEWSLHVLMSQQNNGKAIERLYKPK